MPEIKMSLEEVGALSEAALEGVLVKPSIAKSVARSTVLAERDGIRSHGLMYIPIYAEHVTCGKVDGLATPKVERKRPASIRVDAKSGFAHPAIDAGWDNFINAAREFGVATLSTYNSYNCGVLGHHAERAAEEGLVGLCFTHAPASITPVGGRQPVIGTNPFALGVPDGNGGAMIVIDQSASVVAKSEILLRSRTGKPIETDWALDENGVPTTDASLALKGSMAPAGGYKGFGVGLMVEIMAACISGAVLSKNASPFSGTVGGPPNTGQCFIALDAYAISGSQFGKNVIELASSIAEQEGARLPGARRKKNRTKIEKEGVFVDEDLIARIRQYIKK